MNLFLTVFAILFLTEHLIEFSLACLNLGQLRKNESVIPSFFQGKIPLEEYRKSLAYTRAKAKLGLVESWVLGIVFWLFLLTGSYGATEEWSRSLGLSSILAGLVFLFFWGTIFRLTSLPFRLYATFIIEKRFGFNKTTWKLWLLDLGKGSLLAMVLGGGVGWGVLWFMTRFQQSPWWLYVWLFLAAVQLSLVSLFPVLIVPLFNKLTPLPDGPLRGKIETLARCVKFPLSGVFVMDGSKRSGHSNAFFSGMGKFRRIVLFDTLISTLEEEELLAVLAHEMGHNLRHHVRTSLLLGLGVSLAGLYLLYHLAQASWFYEAFYFRQPSASTALFIFISIYGAFTFWLSPILTGLSRKHEYEADRFVVNTLKTADSMISALVKLSRENLANLTPHPLYSIFYYTHPTPQERIAALQQTAGMLPEQGERMIKNKEI
jgi:STE24 endopeptidase